MDAYGRKRFSLEEAKNYTSLLIDDFKDHYTSLGYHEKLPVNITSGIDPTVLFIGSGISILKPNILEGTISAPGIFIVQNCLRTHNTKWLLNEDRPLVWGSYFTNVVLVAPSERLREACYETFDFFEKRLNIHPQN